MGSRGFLKENSNTFSSIYRLIDLSIICICLFSAAFFYNVQFNTSYLVVMLGSCMLFMYMAELFGVYKSWRIGHFSQMLKVVSAAWALTFLLVTFLTFALKHGEAFSRVTFAIWLATSSVLMVSWRYGFYLFLGHIRRQGRNTRSVAVLGATLSGLELEKQLNAHPEQGLRFVGYYDDRAIDRLPINSCEKKGSVDDAILAAQKGELDLLYVALPLKAEERINEILLKCGNTTCDVHILPDFFVFNLVHSRMAHVGNIPTLSVFESPYFGAYRWVKRSIDIVFSIGILALISLPMLFIAAAVKLTSKGPAIFKQKRYGLDGKQIEVWKFRSMTTMDNGEEVKQATKGDMRITPLGAFLRRTSLDELPQFINVLKGDMSIVGPRPHAVAHNEDYRTKIGYYMLRHKVKPGITGWAQINGWRGETETLEKMEKRVEFDLDYMRHWTPWMDVKIIFLTIFKGFVNKNAY